MAAAPAVEEGISLGMMVLGMIGWRTIGIPIGNGQQDGGWYWDDKVATKKKEPNEPKPKRARKAESKTHDSGAAASSKPDKTPAAKASRKRQIPDSEEKKPAKSKRSTTVAEKEEDVEPKTKKEDVEPKMGKKRFGEEAGETQRCEGQQKKRSGSRTPSRSSIHIERAKERNLRFLEYGQRFD